MRLVLYASMLLLFFTTTHNNHSIYRKLKVLVERVVVDWVYKPRSDRNRSSGSPRARSGLVWSVLVRVMSDESWIKFKPTY
jgi:hypothetical protein